MSTAPALTAQPLTVGGPVTVAGTVYRVTGVQADMITMTGPRGGTVVAHRPTGYRPTRTLQRMSRTAGFTDVRVAGNPVLLAWDGAHLADLTRTRWTHAQKVAFDQAATDGGIESALFLLALGAGQPIAA